MANPFDQFDQPASGSSGNAFDQFDQGGKGSPITDYSMERVKAGEDAERPGWLARQGEGFASAPAKVVRNVDRATGAFLKHLGLDTGYEQRVDNFNDNLARREAAGDIGTTGRIAGEVAESVPAFMMMGPAAAGAVTGLMGTDANGFEGAALDAGAGALGGKAGEILGRGAGRLISGAVNRYAPNVTMATQSPADRAAAGRAVGYVARLMQSSGLTPQDLIQAGSSIQKPLTSAEVIGNNGKLGLAALAKREGATGDAFGSLMKQRALGAPGRMLDDYATAAGIDPRLALGDIEDYVATGRKTVAPMFKQALESNDKGVWNPKLASLSQRPAVQKAMRDVVEDLQNDDIDPTGMGFTGQDPATGKFVQMPRPTAKAWDLVKERLKDQVERDPFGKPVPDTVSRGNFRINKTQRDLVGAMREAIPGYGDALDASGDYLSMQKAFEDGQVFVLNPKVTAAQVQKQLSKLSKPELESFKGGIANKLFDQAQNGRLSANLFYTAKNGAVAPIPAVEEKLSLTLGRDNARRFLTGISNEAQMAQFANRGRYGIQSPTAELTAAMREQDEAGSISGEARDFLDDISPAKRGLVGSAKAGLGAADKWAGRKVSSVTGLANQLGVGMPLPVRDEAGRLLMMHPTDLGRYMQGALTRTGRAARIANAVPQLENSVVPRVIGATAAAAVPEAITNGPGQ